MSVFLYNCLLKWRVFISHTGTGVPLLLLEKVVMNTYVMEAIISLYVFTIVYGRIYAGMHSVLDCAVGSLVGCVVAFLTLKFDHIFGLFLEKPGITGTWLNIRDKHLSTSYLADSINYDARCAPHTNNALPMLRRCCCL